MKLDNFEPQYSLDQGMAGQKALWQRLNLGPETCSLPALIGVLSDEIVQLRLASSSDAAIAVTISSATGEEITSEAIVKHFVSPELLRR